MNFPEAIAERTRRIAASIPAGGLFHEKAWRVSPSAFAIPEALASELDHLGYRLSLFVKACNLLYRLSCDGRQPVWIAELLDRGKPPELVAFAREKRFRDELPRVLRPDLILTENGYSIAELDSVPGGIGLTAWLSRQYADLGEEIVGGARGMIEGFRSAFPGGDIVISREASTYRPEMEWIAAELNATAGQGEAWRVLGDEPCSSWQQRVYRFFELFDLANVRCSSELMERALAGSISVTPPFKPFLEEKLWFALFWLKPLEAFWLRELGERALKALRKAIPYTWLLDPAPLPAIGVIPRLEIQSWDALGHFSHKERELILKVSGFSEKAWGSRGVVVAQDVPQKHWRQELRRALEAYSTQPHILQQFHKGKLFEHPYLDEPAGRIVTMNGRVRLCPYYFPDGSPMRCAGALATICPPDKKLLHGMSEAILAPAAIARS